MSKAVILRCDKCGEWDSNENRVQTIGVAGPRFDLCAKHRAIIIVGMGIEAEKAVEYVRAYDLRKTHKGSPPPLDDSVALDEVEGQPDGTNQAADSADEPTLDLEPPEAETVSKPVSRRAAKK